MEGAFDAEPWRRNFGYRLAIQLLRARRTAEARAVVAKAIEAGAEDDDLPRLGDHLEKIAAAEDAHAEVSDADASLTLAHALRVFDPDRARALFESALKTGDETQSANAAINLGSLLGERDLAGAQHYYELALASQDPLIGSAAAFNLGGLLRASDPVQARGLFQRASESPDAGLAELARQQLSTLG